MTDFLKLPFQIYANDKNWVAPLTSEIKRILNKKLNPYFSDADLALFICYQNSEPVARAIAVVNRKYWERWNRKSAFFGFFESINNQLATNCLFARIEQYCTEHGAEMLEGPFNPNHYSELGLLTENFDSPPVFLETYNPSCYPDLLLNSGFSPAKKIHTRINYDSANYVTNNCKVIQLKDNDFRVRHFKLWRFRSELEKIRVVNNDAFYENPYFLPLSTEEYSFSAKLMFLITSPKLITIIEYRNEPVGVVQCVLNINKILKPLNGKPGLTGFLKFIIGRLSIKEVVIYTVAIKKEFQKSPAASIIYNSLCQVAEKYQVMATTWMSDDNIRAIKSAEKLGIKPYKWFTLYNKKIVSI